MTRPTNEPETATPESDFASRSYEWLTTVYHPDSPTEQFTATTFTRKLERRALSAEKERDELREMLSDLLAANASPSITGFAQACEKARALLNRTKPAK